MVLRDASASKKTRISGPFQKHFKTKYFSIFMTGPVKAWWCSTISIILLGRLCHTPLLEPQYFCTKSVTWDLRHKSSRWHLFKSKTSFLPRSVWQCSLVSTGHHGMGYMRNKTQGWAGCSHSLLPLYLYKSWPWRFFRKCLCVAVYYTHWLALIRIKPLR